MYCMCVCVRVCKLVEQLQYVVCVHTHLQDLYTYICQVYKLVFFVHIFVCMINIIKTRLAVLLCG